MFRDNRVFLFGREKEKNKTVRFSVDDELFAFEKRHMYLLTLIMFK